MTQTEFIKMYCDNSDITEERLNELGSFAVPCDCNYEDCQGWTMISKGNLKMHWDLYLKHNPQFDN